MSCVLQVLTPLQEGQLEAASYPWCPDVWAIAGAAAAQAAASAAKANPQNASAGTSSRGKGGRKGAQAAAAAVASASNGMAAGMLDEDPMAALSMGTDVLQPLMPFMTAFQLLREPVTAKGAGLRLKRKCWSVYCSEGSGSHADVNAADCFSACQEVAMWQFNNWPSHACLACVLQVRCCWTPSALLCQPPPTRSQQQQRWPT